MKLLLTDKNIVFDFGNDIVYAKGGTENGGLQECPKDEATHIWNKETNTACMSDEKISGIRIIEVDKIPDEVKIEEYKYENGKFVINENYVPYVSIEDRIFALEDMVNMLLLNS